MKWLCWLHQAVTSSTHWGDFAAGCKVVGRKVSTFKTVVLCQKTLNWSLWVGSELLPQVKKFKYLMV